MVIDVFNTYAAQNPKPVDLNVLTLPNTFLIKKGTIKDPHFKQL